MRPSIGAGRAGRPGLRFLHQLRRRGNRLAIKLARVNGRRRLISTHGGFHGKTNGALSVTGKPCSAIRFSRGWRT